MTGLSERLLDPHPWSGLIMGNHALARAMLEARVSVVTTYPGSPTPEIAEALTSIPKENRPYYFEYSVNEKVATEVAAGAAFNGHLSAVFFKSVGLNVASDSLIQLGLLELIGGLVVVLGDDPGVNSSQNEQDNRHFCRMAYIPMFEPATPQEAYEMFLEAARLARKHRAPVFLRSTTHVCHAKQVVRFGGLDLSPLDWRSKFDSQNGPYIPITSLVFPMKRRAFEKLSLFEEGANSSVHNAILAPHGAKAVSGRRLGLISSGLPALCLLENLEESGHPVDLLKLGVTHPLPRKKIADFLEQHDEVLIVEELDRVLEPEIKSLAFDSGLRCRILSRSGPEDLMGELDPSRTLELLSGAWPNLFSPRPALKALSGAPPPPRLPQMCPGCGHRSAFQAIKAALDKETITVADIGCHTMGFFPPYRLGELLLSMGHSTGSGAGLAIRNRERKVVAFLGDSTLFHAGLPGLINAEINGHDLTLIIMDNGTTAMTGHQPRAGTGEVGNKIVLAELLKALGVKFIREADTYDQASLRQHVKEALAFQGLAVVIARHPCMLKFVRRRSKSRPGFKAPKTEVNQNVCARHMVCVAEFGCPSFVRNDDGSVTVNPELCIGDGSCLQTCPVQALELPRPGEAK